MYGRARPLERDPGSSRKIRSDCRVVLALSVPSDAEGATGDRPLTSDKTVDEMKPSEPARS
jgi:hypothetical protein